MDLNPFVVEIGGKKFITIRENVMKSGLFREILTNSNIKFDSKDYSQEPQNSDHILISLPQRSSHTFKQVLSYLNDNLHPYPKNLAYELDFYDIEYDINKLYDADDFLNKYELRQCSYYCHPSKGHSYYWNTSEIHFLENKWNTGHGARCRNTFIVHKDDSKTSCEKEHQK